MPQVYELTARFYREKQPVQYEKAGADLTIKAQLSDAEYQAGDAAKLLNEVKTLVLASLGIGVEATAPVNQVAGTPAEGGEPKPVTRKVKATETKPATALSQAPASNPADMASMDGAGKASEPAKAEGISDEDLQKTAAAASQRLGKAQKVKDLMKEYGVARLGELPQDRRADFIKACDALKKDE